MYKRKFYRWVLLYSPANGSFVQLSLRRTLHRYELN